MSRLNGTTLSETQSQVVKPAWLVSMAIANGTGTYDLCAYDADVTWGGKTYTHTAFTVQPMEERQDGTVATQQIVFSIGEQDLATVLGTEANYVWKALDITLVMIDQATGQPMTDAVYAWAGYMTSKSSSQKDWSGTISVIGQDWFSLLDQTGRIRFDNVSQQARNPGDTFFAAMPGLQGQHVHWMSKGNNISPPGGTTKLRAFWHIRRR